jgi:hypothetical protein
MNGSVSILMAAHEVLGQVIKEAGRDEPNWPVVRVKLVAAIEGLQTAARLLSQGASLKHQPSGNSHA